MKKRVTITLDTSNDNENRVYEILQSKGRGITKYVCNMIANKENQSGEGLNIDILKDAIREVFREEFSGDKDIQRENDPKDNDLAKTANEDKKTMASNKINSGENEVSKRPEIDQTILANGLAAFGNGE